MTNTILIKNMVCDRCVMAVETLLTQAGLRPALVTLGEVRLTETPTPAQISQLDGLLHAQGFERIDDRKSQLLEQIKTLVIQAIHHHEPFDMKLNWSDYLCSQLPYDYSYLSSLFSSVAGITLEQYIIRQKVEKVKEYLFYDQLSVKEIAYRLGYSSVAHLSSQFKKVTGLTPSSFKAARDHQERTPLDRIV